MRFNRNITTAVFYLILCQLSMQAFGQQGFSLTLPKPKQYEERTLRSERTDQKKFTLPKRFVQNTITHYNYVFNANNKLNEVLERSLKITGHSLSLQQMKQDLRLLSTRISNTLIVTKIICMQFIHWGY